MGKINDDENLLRYHSKKDSSSKSKRKKRIRQELELSHKNYKQSKILDDTSKLEPTATVSNDDISKSATKQCVDDSCDEMSIIPDTIPSSSSNKTTSTKDKSTNIENKFDALSSEPVIRSDDNNDLEVLQGWFSWSNQSNWSRGLSDIGNACDVKSSTVLEYYKRFLHPRRFTLLPVVQEFLKSCDDADVCYLVDITSAAPLMILGQL